MMNKFTTPTGFTAGIRGFLVPVRARNAGATGHGTHSFPTSPSRIPC